MEWPILVVTVLGTTSISAIVAAILNHRKTSADVEQVQASTMAMVVETSTHLVSKIREEMDARQKLWDARQATMDAQITGLNARLGEVEASARRDRRKLQAALLHIRHQDAHMAAHQVSPLPLPKNLHDIA